MLTKLLAIAANTYTETIRQPIYGVLLAVAAFWIALVSPSLATFTLVSGSDQKVMMDVSLATMLLYGLLTSVFSAAGVITREIESQTVLTVVSKPVSRPVFLVGKYLGVTGAVALGYYLLCLLMFLTVRHGTMETASDKFDQPVLLFGVGGLVISLIAATFGNYVYNWHFPTAMINWAVPLETLALLLVLFISPEWTLQNPADPEATFSNMQLVYASVSAFFGVLILTALAVTLATRFSLVVTLTLAAGVFLLGLMSDYYVGQAATAEPGVLLDALYVAIPNFQFFWLGDPLTAEMMIPGSQVALAAGYALLYSFALLGLGVAMFQTREVG